MLRARIAAVRIDPIALFAGALAASGILLTVQISDLIFFGDDWDPLLYRRGFDADVLLRPHAEHILLGTTLIYKGLQAALGMEQLLPWAIVSTGSFLASVVLLFAYLRRRVGDWLALAGTLPVLFMGSAWEVLLWPFEISFTASIAAGIGALLVLERDDKGGDALACVLLLLSLAFSELALPFLVGAALALILAGRPVSRIYVIAVPLAVYAAWYAGWGHSAENHVSLENIAHSPSYVLDGLSASISSLLGLTDSGTGGLGWGRPLLVGLVAASALRTRSSAPLPSSLWVALAILFAFWLLTAAAAQPGREPEASRYQYVGAVLLLMVVANLVSGVRASTVAVILAIGVAGLATIGNLSLLDGSHRTLHDLATRARGALAGLEVGGAADNPDLVLGPDNTDITSLNSLQVGPYLSAADSFGSPAYSLSELSGAPEEARAAADEMLAKAEGLTLARVRLPPSARPAPPRLSGPEDTAPARRGGCLTFSEGGSSQVISVPSSGVALRAGLPQTVGLRRFATGSFPISLELRGTAVLLIPQDRSDRPWQLQLKGPGPTSVCRL